MDNFTRGIDWFGEKVLIYFQLFLAFVRIGCLAFGGGIAALPLIQKEIVDTYQWLNVVQFIDLLTLSELTPGPIAINSATFVGFKFGGIIGAIIATGSLCLPSIGLVIIVTKFFNTFGGKDIIQRALKGLRSSVIVLMILAGISIARNGILDWFAVGLGILSFVLVWKRKIDPILMLILAGLAGMIFYR